MPTDIYKSALLILNEDSTAFLVSMNKGKEHWIMPGGKIEEGETPEDALVREIEEELGCQLDKESLEHFTDYRGPAAGHPGMMVHIKLYGGIMSGTPTPNSEIEKIGWLSKEDAENPVASETIRVHIIPHLVQSGILK